MQWFIGALKKYADFSGRARRTEFWMYVLFYMIFVVVLAVIEAVIGLPGILTVIYTLGLLVPTISVTVRRLHDTDRSGWWILIGLVPLIGAIVLLVFYFMEGTDGDNQFGPNPKAAAG